MEIHLRALPALVVLSLAAPALGQKNPFADDATVQVASKAAVSGRVTTSVKKSQADLPKEVALAGATVIIGKDLSLDVGGAGVDTVKGKAIAAEASTDASGSFTASVPAGDYTVIVWKAGHTPQTGTLKAPAAGYQASVAPDNQVGSSGRHQRLARSIGR
ncbi:MAG: hypothetical protein HYZ28_19410 [Myxococcales bacterium]|nr:hypothetical protein [Myxococcales bacterium]